MYKTNEALHTANMEGKVQNPTLHGRDEVEFSKSSQDIQGIIAQAQNTAKHYKQQEGAQAPLAEQSQKPTKRELKVYGIADFLSLQIPPRKHLLYPIIPEQGLTMLYAERGTGKTFAALHIAYAVASGGSVFSWQAEHPSPVLYLDGEMPCHALQVRLANIVALYEKCPPHENYLRILTPDLQGDMLMPNIATPLGQADLEPHLQGVKLVVVDNIATLARTCRSNDEDAWKPVQDWLLRLRRRGISVLLIHHTSKSGSQRGSTAKEDILDTSIYLKRPNDYETDQGARFEVHYTKSRGFFGEDADPFEAHLVDEQWVTKPLSNSHAEQVKDLADSGLSIREIAEDIGLSKSAVARICKKHTIRTGGQSGRKKSL